MQDIGKKAKQASQQLALSPTNIKNAALTAAAQEIRNAVSEIKAANDKDMDIAKGRGLTGAMLDRLLLDDERIEAIALSIEAIVQLEDPIGDILQTKTRPNGLQISQVRVPLGVIGIIYDFDLFILAKDSFVQLRWNDHGRCF